MKYKEIKKEIKEAKERITILEAELIKLKYNCFHELIRNGRCDVCGLKDKYEILANFNVGD